MTLRSAAENMHPASLCRSRPGYTFWRYSYRCSPRVMSKVAHGSSVCKAKRWQHPKCPSQREWTKKIGTRPELESFTTGKIHELHCIDESQEPRVEGPKHVAEEHIQCDAIYLVFTTCQTKQYIFRNEYISDQTIRMVPAFVGEGWERDGVGHTEGSKYLLRRALILHYLFPV